MKCPKCGSWFEVVTFEEIEIERCTDCKGLWFDMLERDDLLRMEGSEAIDIGSEQVGKKFDKVEHPECPRCSVKMIAMIDKDQFHIHYECCPSCYGTFFDAGEFRDLKEHTVAERFMQMVRTIRTNL